MHGEREQRDAFGFSISKCYRDGRRPELGEGKGCDRVPLPRIEVVAPIGRFIGSVTAFVAAHSGKKESRACDVKRPGDEAKGEERSTGLLEKLESVKAAAVVTAGLDKCHLSSPTIGLPDRPLFENNLQAVANPERMRQAKRKAERKDHRRDQKPIRRRCS